MLDVVPPPDVLVEARQGTAEARAEVAVSLVQMQLADEFVVSVLEDCGGRGLRWRVQVGWV